MSLSTARYLRALYAASDALMHGTDLACVMKATERLRRIAPDQGMLPPLDAKIARMRIINSMIGSAWGELITQNHGHRTNRDRDSSPIYEVNYQRPF